jgi:hypothetical protein
VVGRLDHGHRGLLVAFWWVPFGTEQAYSTSMGYVNVHTFVAILLPQADWWALILAGLSAVAAFALRSRFGILMALLAGVFALAVIFDPAGQPLQRPVPPLWFLPVYLLAGWGVATAVTGAVDLWPWWRARRRRQPAAVAASEEARLVADPPAGPVR